MKKIFCLFSIIIAASLMFTAGCESDITPDEITFKNSSTHQVSVALVNTANNTTYRFTLQPDGGETKYPKVLIEPLTYSYSPTATVSDRRDDNKVIFENRK